MEAARGSSAPGAVILPIGMVKVVMLMADDKALMYYQSTMRIAQQWLGSGLITAEDYEKFDTIVAEKFGVSAHTNAYQVNFRKTIDIRLSPSTILSCAD